MSNKTSFAYGYGIDETDLNRIPNSAMANFIKKHLNIPNSEMNLQDKELVDLYSCCEDNNTGAESVFSVISNVITNETGITMECHKSEYNTAIMLAKVAPWMYLSKEKELTEESFNEVLLQYLQELEIEDTVLSDVEVEIFD